MTLRKRSVFWLACTLTSALCIVIIYNCLPRIADREGATGNSETHWHSIPHLSNPACGSERQADNICVSDPESVSQDDVDAMAEHLVITCSVVSNTAANDSVLVSITLENAGDQAVGGRGWGIYFCYMYKLFPKAKLSGSRSVEAGRGINVSHVNGCLYRMFPAAGTFHFEKDRPVVLNLVAAYWLIAKSDFMPNWYVAAEGIQPRVIARTAEGIDFVSPIDSQDKWKRKSQDRFNPITPAERYGYYHSTARQNSRLRPIPLPKLIRPSRFSKDALIALNDATWLLENEQDLYAKGFLMTLKFMRGTLGATTKDADANCDDHHICVKFAINSSITGEAYAISLLSESKTILVEAGNDGGALAAARTLYQLKMVKGRLSALFVEDSPRYHYRGMMLDIVRHFLTKDAIMKFVDVISLFKLNYLHLHLTDDEGWRLEIDGLPELTKVASKSCHDLTERSCILPQFGGEPYGESFSLSKEDYVELLQYAAERNVKIIPELDMPGHSHAAIKAMEARYARAVAAGKKDAATEYLLSDLEDRSVYSSIQSYTDNAMNPCLDSTYNFVRKIVRTVQLYHREAGHELNFVHLGGDEVPAGAWVNSSACLRLLRSVDSDPAFAHVHLKKHFVRSVFEITSEAGLGLAMWEDGFMDRGIPYDLSSLTPDVDSGNRQPLYAFVWQNVWEWGAAKRAYQLANAGYKVVLAPATHYYFDHAQEPDPEERGLYWAARFTGINKTFAFMPDDMYANMNHDVSRFGEPLSKARLCPANRNAECPSLNRTAASNIIGIEGTLFSETCLTESYAQALAFPRVLALAERAWHKAAWESVVPDTSAEFYALLDSDWSSFATSLGQYQLPLLDQHGITYHLNPPGVIESNGMWLANSEFPGQEIEYSFDGGREWVPYDSKAPPTTEMRSLLFTTVVHGSTQRRSRSVQVTANWTR